ncbi:MAG: HAMP domain-containing histidine kinase [Oscillospiraceae bacterium]|nr:HAMP domain-containing histidine kinase [Oscillospiraceae bacterium]
MAVKRITKRWLYNSFLVILLLLSAVIIASAVFIRGYFYNNALQIMRSNATVNDTLLVNYAEDSSVDFDSALRSVVEGFDMKDKMELMAIDATGQVILTSSGFSPSSDLSMPDFEEALSSSTRDGVWEGSINNEPIIAYSLCVSTSADSELTALRYVVSLSEINAQIILYIAMVAVVCMIIIFFVVISNSYFISSVVNPVDQVGKTAQRIAHGDFSVRLQKRYDDEVGELCDVINYMAEELQENEKMKNDFISSVSHELRTPLTAIRGWAETLKDGDADQETMQKGMGVILKESDRLSSMVEELLDFSRIQSGRMQLNLSKLDLIAELSDAVLMFVERAKREQIELVYDEPMDIIPINADPNRLRQVFINIIDNAIKYSDSGDSVTVAASLLEDRAVVTIADTGCGINSTDLPKIKEKFYKANSTRRGSGIGLAVADEIISLHGGNLSIGSVEGSGTTVTISLPLAKNNP